MEIVKRPHALNMVRFAKDRPEVLVLSADLTSSCEANDFRETYPKRFYSMGLAEQNMVSFAAGLAREGFYPFIHTFAVFICRRPFDQVAMSVAYPNLPVRFIGFLPGITTPGGVTHQAVDDVALMRLIPNMRVLECGDATEVESVLEVAQDIDGPVYVRMLRGEVSRIFKIDDPFVFNKARVLNEGKDLTVLTSGICTEEAIKAVSAMSKKGVYLHHLHISTLKPFDDPKVTEAISSPGIGIITMENHLISGGLGTCVAELMAEQGAPAKLLRLGLNDEYAHGASRGYLMKKYGLDAPALVRAVEKLTGDSLDIDEEEFLVKVPESDVLEAKPEDL